MRLMQLTYNSQTLLGAGCTERSDAGLSSLGLQVVDCLNKHDIIIDLAHCGTQTTLDVIGESDDPVMLPCFAAD